MEIGETYRRTNITATLHQSGLYVSVAKLNPLISEDMKTHLEFAKKHLKDPQTVRNKIIWSDEPQIQAYMYVCVCVYIRAVRLIEIESQSRFETLRFANCQACDVDAILLCSRTYAWLPALSDSLTNQ